MFSNHISQKVVDKFYEEIINKSYKDFVERIKGVQELLSIINKDRLKKIHNSLNKIDPFTKKRVWEDYCVVLEGCNIKNRKLTVDILGPKNKCEVHLFIRGCKDRNIIDNLLPEASGLFSWFNGKYRRKTVHKNLIDGENDALEFFNKIILSQYTLQDILDDLKGDLINTFEKTWIWKNKCAVLEGCFIGSDSITVDIVDSGNYEIKIFMRSDSSQAAKKRLNKYFPKIDDNFNWTEGRYILKVPVVKLMYAERCLNIIKRYIIPLVKKAKEKYNPPRHYVFEHNQIGL